MEAREFTWLFDNVLHHGASSGGDSLADDAPPFAHSDRVSETMAEVRRNFRRAKWPASIAETSDGSRLGLNEDGIDEVGAEQADPVHLDNSHPLRLGKMRTPSRDERIITNGNRLQTGCDRNDRQQRGTTFPG